MGSAYDGSGAWIGLIIVAGSGFTVGASALSAGRPPANKAAAQNRQISELPNNMNLLLSFMACKPVPMLIDYCMSKQLNMTC
jgi:hypothetical protein